MTFNDPDKGYEEIDNFVDCMEVVILDKINEHGWFEEIPEDKWVHAERWNELLKRIKEKNDLK